jgi:hypothetical protein
VLSLVSNELANATPASDSLPTTGQPGNPSANPISDFPSNLRRYFDTQADDDGVRYIRNDPPDDLFRPLDSFGNGLTNTAPGSKEVMNPYIGSSVSQLPKNANTIAVVLGDLRGLTRLNSGAENMVPIPLPLPQRSTESVWRGEGRNAIDQTIRRLNDESGPTSNAEVQIFRRFMHPLTKRFEFLPLTISSEIRLDSAAQRIYSTLLPEKYVGQLLPSVVDETPTNVLSPTNVDKAALRLQRLVVTSALIWGAMKDARLENGSKFLSHFLAGSGDPIKISPRDMQSVISDFLPGIKTLMYPGTDPIEYRLRNSFPSLSVQGVVGDAIRREIASGRTSGSVSVVSDDVVNSTGARYALALGDAHFQTAYSGNWSLNKHGLVSFRGDRQWMVADRYNWGVADFNGLDTSSVIQMPNAFVSSLPQAYRDAFVVRSGDGNRGTDQGFDPSKYHVSNALWGYLQMLKGGAQPFWSVGVTKPERIDVTWDIQKSSSP